ncbi:MAG: hypothetical protein ABR526_07745 [Chthoniobacterales bacterium]
MKFALLFSLACFALMPVPARAGDAVAIGYNADGVWTSVIYYSSSTGKGGADYKDETGAREAAVRDLKQRAGEGVVRTSILASSDRTAYASYARGKTAAGKDVHAVGYGPTDSDAKAKAFADLKRQGAAKELKVIYHYFSHGPDDTAPADLKPPRR